MKQISKDNHYVPKLYLKQWARDGKISTYRLLVANDKCRPWRDHSLKSIAFHQHLYTYIAGQQETDEFEKWLDREFEHPAKNAIDKVVNEKKITREDWRCLIRFLASQDVRTPARLREFLSRQRRDLEGIMNETLTKSVKELEKIAETKDQLPKPTGHKDDLFPFRVSITKNNEGGGEIRAEAAIGRQLWLACSRYMLTSTINHLFKHKWSILRAPKGINFPTSDNPVIRLNFYNENHYDFQGGWGRLNGEILLPLSPKHLMYTKIGAKPPMRGTILSGDMSYFIRKLIIEHGERFIFSREEEDISSIRQRTVDANAYAEEKSAWEMWHEEQSNSERSFVS